MDWALAVDDSRARRYCFPEWKYNKCGFGAKQEVSRVRGNAIYLNE
jgi:hypothetical protein